MKYFHTRFHLLRIVGIILAILVILLVEDGAPCDEQSLTFHLDLQFLKLSPFPHFWERCVGSGHASLALREDYRKQLKLAHEELGFQFVRFHGILHDDMSVYLPNHESSLKTKYHFFNVDSIIDFLLSIDMKPLIELSFMPSEMASGNQTCFHYGANVTPPRKWSEWYELIEMLVRHLVDRYGVEEVKQWYFEVWNEPNLKYFWSGTKHDYFMLYNTTAMAIKNIDPSLRVGGPATMQSGWIDDFLHYVHENQIPFDFISTHEYPTDITPLNRNTMKHVISETRNIIGPNIPLLYTEFNAGLNNVGSGTLFYQDSSYPAAFLVKTFADTQGLVDVLSYWTFSDLFEEHGMISTPFSGAFGLMNIYGIRKPAWRAFEMLHKAGNYRISVEESYNQTSIDVLALYKPPNHPLSSHLNMSSVTSSMKDRQMQNQNGEVMIFISNYDVPTQKQHTYQIEIHCKLNWTMNQSAYLDAFLYRIDEDNANVAKEWMNMGSPQYPTPQQIQQLHESSKLTPQLLKCHLLDKQTCKFIFDVPPFALNVLSFTHKT